MKKTYVAPTLEIELYELSESIASNCTFVVNQGPVDPTHATGCQSYYDVIGEEMPTSWSLPHNVDFYDRCDCYYSASGKFFTS